MNGVFPPNACFTYTSTKPKTEIVKKQQSAPHTTPLVGRFCTRRFRGGREATAAVRIEREAEPGAVGVVPQGRSRGERRGDVTSSFVLFVNAM